MTLIEILQKTFSAQDPASNPLVFLVITVLLALIPIAFGLLTSYVKISIVIGIIKNALGTQHAPSAMLSLALSLSLTMLTMNPVFKETLLIAKDLDVQTFFKSPSEIIVNALSPLLVPWEKFLRCNAGQKEIMTLMLAVENQADTAKLEINRDSSEENNFNHQVGDNVGHVEWSILIPAFLLTELKEGFSMAFVVLLPFLAIDLIISNILMGLGMMMVSPVLISLPIKLILFVISDSWLLITQGLIRSYQV